MKKLFALTLIIACSLQLQAQERATFVAFGAGYGYAKNIQVKGGDFQNRKVCFVANVGNRYGRTYVETFLHWSPAIAFNNMFVGLRAGYEINNPADVYYPKRPSITPLVSIGWAQVTNDGYHLNGLALGYGARVRFHKCFAEISNTKNTTFKHGWTPMISAGLFIFPWVIE